MFNEYNEIKNNIHKQIKTQKSLIDLLKFYRKNDLQFSIMILQLMKIYYNNNIYYINKEYCNNINNIIKIIKSGAIEYYNNCTTIENEYVIVPKYACYNIEKKLLIEFRLGCETDLSHTLAYYCFICKKNYPSPKVNCSLCDNSFHSECILNYNPSKSMYCPLHICSLCKNFIKDPVYVCKISNISYCFKSYCTICTNYLKNNQSDYLSCNCINTNHNTKTIELNKNERDINQHTTIIIPKYANYNVSHLDLINWNKIYQIPKSKNTACFICKKSINDLLIGTFCEMKDYYFHTKCIFNFTQLNNMKILCPSHFCSVCKKYITKFSYQCNNCFYSCCDICITDKCTINKCPCIEIKIK